MDNTTITDASHRPDDGQPRHEHILEQVLSHLLTPPDGAVLEAVCEQAHLPTLVGDDGWSVATTGVRPAQEELLTDQRGVVVELSDGSNFALLIDTLQPPREHTTVVGPEQQP